MGHLNMQLPNSLYKTVTKRIYLAFKIRNKMIDVSVAQLVEHCACNAKVEGAIQWNTQLIKVARDRSICQMHKCESKCVPWGFNPQSWCCKHLEFSGISSSVCICA